MSETRIVNSDASYKETETWLFRLYQEKKYLVLGVRAGEDRSLTQNALFHVWLTEYAAHLLKKDKKQVTSGELAGMKRAAKQQYFKETRDSWMVETVTNPLTLETKTDFTSSADWSHDEMFLFLTWLQGFAATENGLALESKGRFKVEQEKRKAA